MALTGSQYKRILETLLLAYKYEELRIALKGCMDVDLDNVVAQEKNYSQQLAELIEWADRQGRTMELLRCAYEGNKTNPQLAALWQDAQSWSLGTPQPESPPLTVPERSKKRPAVLIIASIVLFALLAASLGIYAVTRNSTCTAFQEKNGSVVIEAEHFTDRRPGREHSSQQPVRSGVGIEWLEREGIMHAEPDDEPRNTMSEINGPALIYAIEFGSPGEYQVYIRGYGADPDGDSIHVGLNGIAITVSRDG